MCIPHFLYPFICQWTFRYYQFPYLGYWEQCCSEQEVQISLQEPDFNFFWIYTHFVGSYGSSYRHQNPNGIFTELEKQLLGQLPQTFFFKINFGEGIIKLQLVYSWWEYKMVYSLWKNGSSTIKNRATMSILIQVFMWIHVFMSLGDKSRSGIARQYGNSMFHIWRNYQIVSQSGCIILYPCQQWVPISSQLCKLLLFSVFFYYSHPSRCEVESHPGFDLHYSTANLC